LSPPGKVIELIPVGRGKATMRKKKGGEEKETRNILGKKKSEGTVAKGSVFRGGSRGSSLREGEVWLGGWEKKRGG